MLKHFAAVHERKKYKCEICKDNFAFKQDLKIHIAIIHENQEKVFEKTISPDKNQRLSRKRIGNNSEENENPYKKLCFTTVLKEENIQGQSWQSGFFELALRDRNMQVRFF